MGRRKKKKEKRTPLEWDPDVHPVRFEPIGVEKIWGDGALRKKYDKPFNKTATIGESWEIADRDDTCSVVADGPLKGTDFRDLLFEQPEKWLGKSIGLKYRRKFPLLVKLLDCSDYLSVQVHPSDEFARRFESEETGKMEAWYVLSAPKNGKIYRGILPGTTQDEFKELIRDESVIDCLNEVEAKEGDVIFIPPGTVHTAGEGMILLEVSQNCDTTYRLFDWGRKRMSRKVAELQEEKGLRMIDFYSMGISKIKPIPVKESKKKFKRRILLKAEKFSIEGIKAKRGTHAVHGHPDKFRIYVSTYGKGSYRYGPDRDQVAEFKEWETWYLPAALGDYDIRANGKLELLQITV